MLLQVFSLVQALTSVVFWVVGGGGVLMFLYICFGHDVEAPALQTIKDWVCVKKNGYHLNMSMETIVEWIGSFVNNRYTAFTSRVHIPKAELGCSKGMIVPSISFMGGGHLWCFAIGVGHYMFVNYDLTDCKFLASSSGCFSAVPLACGLDPYQWCKNDWGKCIAHFDGRHWVLQMMNLACLCDKKQFYYDLWNDYLPDDAHVRCSGRLYISTTLYPSLVNKVMSQFDSREQLIWAIVGSICLPIGFIGDFPVDIPGVGTVIDGGFSNDSPCLDTYTVTASALHNESDISPRYLNEDDLGAKYLANPISFLDIVKTPTYDRVWQIAKVGEAAARQCKEFQREEWLVRKVPLPTIPIIQTVVEKERRMSI